MAKKKFASPFVLFTLPVESPDIDANASAHGGLGDDDDGTNSVVYPMNYEAWLGNVGAELDGNTEAVDWGDYKAWFVINRLDTNQMDPLIDPNPEG